MKYIQKQNTKIFRTYDVTDILDSNDKKIDITDTLKSSAINKLTYSLFENNKICDQMKEIVQYMYDMKELPSNIRKSLQSKEFANKLKAKAKIEPYNLLKLTTCQSFEFDEIYNKVSSKIKSKIDNSLSKTINSIKRSTIDIKKSNDKFEFKNRAFLYHKLLKLVVSDNKMEYDEAFEKMLKECNFIIGNNNKIKKLIAALTTLEKKEFLSKLRVFRGEHIKKINREQDNSINIDYQMLNLIIDKLKSIFNYATYNKERKTLKDFYTSNNKVYQRLKTNIKNSFNLFLIKYGKIATEVANNKNEIDSNFLTKMHLNEVMSRKLTSNIMQSTMSLRNICNYFGNDDILTSNVFVKAKKNIDKDRLISNLKLFFASSALNVNYINENNAKDILEEFKHCINAYRNNIFHGRNLLNILDNGSDCLPNAKQLFQNEVNNISSLLKGKLVSMKILDFYEISSLNRILDYLVLDINEINNCFNPSFKNIVKYGMNLDKFKDLSEFTGDNYNAYYNLMNLIYKKFVIEFEKNNKKMFENAVEKTFNEKKKRNSRFVYSKYENIAAYKDFNDPIKYMKYLHSNLYFENYINESKKNRKQKDNKQKDNYSKFIKELYIHGFVDYLNETKLYELLNNQSSYKLNFSLEDLKLDYKTQIKYDEKNYINFYMFTKLLDTKSLGELHANLLKMKKTDSSDKLNDYIFIVKLSLLSNDLLIDNSEFINDDEINNLMKKFIDPELYDNDREIYKNGNKPILFTHMIKLLKYGSINDLNLITKEYKVTKLDLENYQEILMKIKDEGETSKISNFSNDVKVLHDKLIKRDRITKNDPDYKEYVRKLRKLNSYEQLHNKVYLYDIVYLQTLKKEIYSRIISLTSLFERNYYNVLKSIYEQLGKELKLKNTLDKNIELEHSEVANSLMYFSYGNIKQLKSKRNKIVHMNYYYHNNNESKCLNGIIKELKPMHNNNICLKNEVNKILNKSFIKFNLKLEESIVKSNNNIYLKKFKKEKISLCRISDEKIKVVSSLIGLQ